MTRSPMVAVVGLGAALASAIAPRGAMAGSRFETTPTTSAGATANLDFSIVVPEVIYLGPRRSDGSENGDRPFAPKISLNIRASAPYAAITNGGTLAFSATEETQIRPAEPGGENSLRKPPLNRVYVVAMP